MWTPDGVRYRRPLGSGGEASVFLGEDTRSGERLSVKHVPLDRGEEVLREFAVLAGIEYPGLPRVVEYGTRDDRAFYTYRHSRGGSLRAVGRARDPAAWDRSAVGLLGALLVLHELGYLHYDVSPGNVLLTKESSWRDVLLIDAGFAGPPGLSLRGTPGYTAPEILAGFPGGRASDLFAAGILLAEYALGPGFLEGNTPRERLEDLERRGDEIRAAFGEVLGEARADLLGRLLEPDAGRREADACLALRALGAAGAAGAGSCFRTALEAVVRAGLTPGARAEREILRVLDDLPAASAGASDPAPVLLAVSPAPEFRRTVLSRCLKEAARRAVPVRRCERAVLLGGAVSLTSGEVEEILAGAAGGGPEAAGIIAPGAGDPVVVRADGISEEELARGLERLNFEAGSAEHLARRIVPEVRSGRFSTGAFLAYLAAEGHLRRSSCSWLAGGVREEWLARGLSAAEIRVETASLGAAAREALLDLAAAAEFPSPEASARVARARSGPLRPARDRLVRPPAPGEALRLYPPALAAFLRDAAEAEEIRRAHARVWRILEEEREPATDPARVYHRLRAGRGTAEGDAEVLEDCLDAARMAQARLLARALREADASRVDLCEAAAWTAAEAGDEDLLAACLSRAGAAAGRSDSLRYLDALLEYRREGRISWRRGRPEGIARAAMEALVGDRAEGEEGAGCALARLESAAGLAPPAEGEGGAERIARLGEACRERTPAEKRMLLPALNAVARRLFTAGRVGEAREAWEVCRRTADAWGLRLWRFRFEGNVASCLLREGRLARAREILERVAREHEARGDVRGAAAVWGNLGVAAYQAGDVDAARRSFERQELLVREGGRERDLPFVRARLGGAWQELGDWARAEREYRAAARLAPLLGDADTEIVARVNLGHLLLAAGRIGEAREQLRKLRDLPGGEAGRNDDVADLERACVLATGTPVLDASATVRILLEEKEDDERMETALRNAVLLGLDLSVADLRNRLERDFPDHLHLALLVDRLGIDGPDAPDRLREAVEKLPERVLDTETVAAAGLAAECAVLLLSRGNRLPGRVLEVLRETAKRAELPGLTFRVDLARGLRRLAQGRRAQALESFRKALRGMVRCAGPGEEIPGPGTVPDFALDALDGALRELEEELLPGGTGGSRGRRSLLGLLDRLARVALAPAMADAGGGRWERGLEHVLSVSRTMNATRDLDRLLTRIVESVLVLCDAEHGFVVLLDDEGEPRVHTASDGIFSDPGTLEGRVSRTVVERVLSSRESVLIPNALDAKDLLDRPSVRSLSLRSVMCAPLGYEDRLLGAIFVDNRSAAGSFGEGDLKLLEVFAHQAAVAIENGKIFQELERSYRALQEAQEINLQSEKLRSLGMLAGGIAHDFNNILTAILGNADLALRDLGGDSGVRDRVEEIKHAVLAAGDLCRQLLAYAGKGCFLMERLDLSAVVAGIREMLEVSMPPSVKLFFDLGKGLPPVEGDASQVRQVVLNLVTNAAEAVEGSGGEVRVTTGVHEAPGEEFRGPGLHGNLPRTACAFLEVSDTGEGMNEATAARIFDPFFSTRFTGRGLGLAAVLGIVRGHEGAVHVETEPGRGTRIRVFFPAAGREEAACAPLPAPAETRAREAVILLVDDEEAVLEVAREMILELGFSVITARDGREAVEIFRERGGEIDLVILDLSMPRMSGEEALARIREIRADARVMISTGFSEADTSRLVREGGAAGLLQKPYELGDLERKIHGILSAPSPSR